MAHLMSNDRLSTWWCNLVPTSNPGIRFWNITSSVTFVSSAPARFRDSPSIFQSREEVEAVYSLPLGMLQAMTYRYLFKQHDTAVASIVSGLRERIQDWGKPFIGFHVRNGDKVMKAAPENRKLPKLPDLTELLKAAKRCSGLSVFIASDDPLMVAMMQTALPSSVLALTCCGRGIHVGSMNVADMAVREHGNASRISYNAQNAMREIFVVYELLSGADALVSLGRGHVGSDLKAAAYWELERQVPLYKSLNDANTLLRRLC